MQTLERIFVTLRGILCNCATILQQLFKIRKKISDVYSGTEIWHQLI